LESTVKTARPPSWQILLAFAIIYFVWGSTFLAIRVGVREANPAIPAGSYAVFRGWLDPVCLDAPQRLAVSDLA
jgi:hypothetical protein